MNVRTFKLAGDALMPNSDLPVITLSDLVAETSIEANEMAARFETNGWQGTWTYTIFDYWHYHIEGHEVLGCVGGEATVGLGGPCGIEIKMRPGDVVLIPAGVGHKRLSGTDDFAVVGAYPEGQNGSITRAGSLDLEKARAMIGGLALPEQDPVIGEKPGHLRFWK